ncbi:pro-opiomelanocortin-like [Etheostoma cragini]|uniref:pro-opiomelanocortin-like n=1 Tax=Etheostoma cragini TaxID=417921 RepID=UPI00155EA1C5|nr:pro-opiomelanocortin-like [Etheostoma cragini]XP_034756498.1 pro-opiomelanocortin-like [Etheostoma cragini]XP_034756499.1 pro-opiomelanocortin-like [Etheostoma cragini]
MMCQWWLLVVVMAYVCHPGLGSVCWDSSICKDLHNKGRILDCLQLCMSVIRMKLPQLTALALKVNNDDDLILSIILATLVSANKISETNLKGRSDERRSYSMEHFRWGKPTGRKRRPVKVFVSSSEGGGSFEGRFLPQARRQLSSYEDEVKLNGKSSNQAAPRARVSSLSHVPLSSHEKTDGTYRMSHFRWGSPPASKRNGSSMKPWEKKPQGQLAKLFRNNIVKDVQNIVG